jgi:hypothetical protein
MKLDKSKRSEFKVVLPLERYGDRSHETVVFSLVWLFGGAFGHVPNALRLFHPHQSR